jgi:zinc protease
VCLAACASGRAAPDAPPRHTNLGLRISEQDLPNGLRVVVVADPHASQVQVTMRYRVGSVDDPQGKEGMAHLVEHLMFQQHVGAQTVFTRLEQDATYFNGITTLDSTTYVARASVDRLEELVSFEGVRMGLRCTSIDDAAFAREREVVLNELRLRDEGSELMALVRGALYPDGHPYRRSDGGSEQSVGTITREEACAFADAHYAASNAALVISGPMEPAAVDTALRKFLSHVPNRVAEPQVAAPAVALGFRQLAANVPLDDDALLVAWPLPASPRVRAQVRAVAAMVTAVVDAHVRGRVAVTELGDARAPMLAMFVVPASDESYDDVRVAAQKALDAAPVAFTGTGLEKLDRFLFEMTKQSAITELFGTLEDGSGRDQRLAGYVLAGKNPSQAIELEMEGLREMSRESAADTVRQYLSYERATVVKLEHGNVKKRGHEPQLVASTHDVGSRRVAVDPALAHEPAQTELDARGFVGIRTRTLANGLRVVLLPLTSVPTVDVRIVFAAGTADESVAARGAALVAAQELGWGPHSSEDLILFLAAGGRMTAEAGLDHTTFQARGLDMHVDLLLTGVARLVRDGEYGSDARAVVSALRHQRKKIDDEGALTDAWRNAVYGAQHPYVDAGLVRHASRTLTVKDASEFRAAHYTPDNAIIVIAGRFDPVLADKWVDYLFADWKGTAQPHSEHRAHPSAASIGRVDDTTQIAIEVSLPATAGTPAEQLVAANMLDQIAADVRNELGASYAMNAELDEARFATSYDITGFVEVGRAQDAMDLVAKRIAQLRTDPDAAASAFVAARQRALVQLMSVTGSASSLAERVDRDVALGREPMANVQTANAVKALSIDAMAPVLADLDLARATVLVRGPEDDVRHAFATLGREPTFVEPAKTAVAADSESPADEGVFGPAAPDAEPEADRAAKQTPSSSVTFLVAPGYTSGQYIGVDMKGLTVAADVGFNNTRYSSIGIHATFGSLSGHIHNFVTDMDVGIVPVSLQLYGRGVLRDRYWIEAGIGANVAIETQTVADSAAGMSMAVMLQAGADILDFDRHRLGAYLRFDSDIEGDAFYATTFGLAYRY